MPLKGRQGEPQLAVVANVGVEARSCWSKDKKKRNGVRK